MITGETDPARLLARTTGKLRSEPARLRDALQGRVTAHHRFLLQLHLDHIRAVEAAIHTLDARLRQLMAPFRPLIDHLCTMPGVSTIVAQTLLAERGPDMTRFPTPAHVLSWAGLCPRQDESAGKRRSTRVRHGAPWLKTVMVQAAWAAVRQRDSYPRAQYHRLKARRGPRKALVAVAASLLTVAYVLLRDQVDYRDLGAHHFDALDKGRAARRLVRRLEALGFTVTANDAA